MNSPKKTLLNVCRHYKITEKGNIFKTELQKKTISWLSNFLRPSMLYVQISYFFIIGFSTQIWGLFIEKCNANIR